MSLSSLDTLFSYLFLSPSNPPELPWESTLRSYFGDSSSRLPWEVTITTPEEGYRNVIVTFVAIIYSHSILCFFLLPLLITVFSNYKYTFKLTNKLAIKMVSLSFDIIAVAGGVKEIIAPEIGVLRDPLYGFSSHSEFHYSLAAAYFAWATITTLLFGSGPRKKLLLPLIHHTSCALIFLMSLHPFVHHTGNIFLLFQCSSLILDLHSITRIINLNSGYNRTLRFIHPFVFFVVRITLGIPLSLNFLRDMGKLLYLNIGHDVYVIVFMIVVNLGMNCMNVYWFVTSVVMGRFNEKSWSVGGGSGSGVLEWCEEEVGFNKLNDDSDGSTGDGKKVTFKTSSSLSSSSAEHIAKVKKMRVVDLTAELKARGLVSYGLKEVLVKRLIEDDNKVTHENENESQPQDAPSKSNRDDEEEAVAKLPPTPSKSRSPSSPPRTDDTYATNLRDLKTPTLALRLLRLYMVFLSLLVSYLILMHSNFILVPTPASESVDIDINGYGNTLYGDSYRDKSRAADLRADNLVREFLDQRKRERESDNVELASASTDNIGILGQQYYVNGALPAFDIVISGGGFRGQYAGGVLAVLTKLSALNVISIDRWAGTSIGACTAASFAVGQEFETFYRVPYAWQNVWRVSEFWKGGRVVREMLRQTFKEVDMAKINGKLFVSVTVFDGMWPTSLVVSNFTDKDDLMEALAAGATIPGFTGNPIISEFRGKSAMDGGLTLNTPVFKDGKNTQLVINLGYLKYPVSYTFGVEDENYEELVFRGMDDAIRLLKGEGVLAIKVIKARGSGSDADADGSEGHKKQNKKSKQKQILSVLQTVRASAYDLVDSVMHLIEYDAVPWATVGFASEIMGGTVLGGVLLFFLGVYD